MDGWGTGAHDGPNWFSDTQLRVPLECRAVQWRKELLGKTVWPLLLVDK